MGAEIERHCDICALLEGKLVEMRDTFQRNLSEEGGCYRVSIRHKYPFGKIDVPMTDFMQHLWNDRNTGHNSAKFVGMQFYCS